MKDGYFLIGEVSKITGISKDTLHFYSKTGLVVPDYIDPENQYRYYSRWNMWQLDIVATCRKLSVPLEKVKRLMSYHDNKKIVELLSEYQKEALRHSSSIPKKYGYVLDVSGLESGAFIKQREYLKLNQIEERWVPKECLYELPDGDYVVSVLHIQNEKADFQPLLQWLNDNGEEADMIFAEELGLQLFDYIPDYYCGAGVEPFLIEI